MKYCRKKKPFFFFSYCSEPSLLFFSRINFRYQQYFDLEGESGIVVRGIGTAVILTKIDNNIARYQHGRTQLGSSSQAQSSTLNEE